MKKVAVVVLCLTILSLACGDDNTSDPTAPAPGSGLQKVENSIYLEGSWHHLAIIAGGLDISRILIPAFTAGNADSRIAGFDTDLLIESTGSTSGIFSAKASGTAIDTAAVSHSRFNSFDRIGSFSLPGNGQIRVTINSDTPGSDGKRTAYLGTAMISADTLIINFNLATPPYKDIVWLPDTTFVVARFLRISN